jgi:uncharacterized protein
MADQFLAARSGVREKLAAIAKAVAFLLLAFVGAILATAVAKALFGGSLLELAQRGAATGTIRALLLLLGTVILPTALVLLFFRERLRLSGWATGDARRLLAWGLATGFGLIAAIAGPMWLCGAVTFSLAVPSLSAALPALLFSAILWLAQAAGEEGLNRGYAFVQLCRALSFWPAAILSSAWFLYGHIGNPNETAAGIVATGLFGLALSYSLLKTGSLWFALGFHAAWNFTQSFVFGFPNSGASPPASLLTAKVMGSPLVTGGTAGPEASLFVLPALIVLVLVMRRKSTAAQAVATTPAATSASISASA